MAAAVDTQPGSGGLANDTTDPQVEQEGREGVGELVAPRRTFLSGGRGGEGGARAQSTVRRPLMKQVSLQFGMGHDHDELHGKEVRPILEGSLINLPPISSKTVRVFLSSTFSDMVHERNALMEHVYPKLKNFCREKYGLEFQVVDLRWGVRQESQNDHSTIDVCLQEIDNCHKDSVGPNFVLFMGQKYGYRPFPNKILAEEFTHIYSVLLNSHVDVSILDTWFRLDENSVPALYVVQPITSVLPNYHSQDQELRQAAEAEWYVVFGTIQRLLRRGADICHKLGHISDKEREKYFVSVTEYEIDKGLMESSNPHKDALCFYRTITNINDNLSNNRALKYIDLVPQTSTLDEDAQALLRRLIEKKITKKITNAQNIEQFGVSWENPEGADPNDEAEYLQRFCNLFREKMKMLIARSLTYMQNLQNNPNLVEVLQHLNMGRWRSDIFRGREDIIDRVNDYLSKPTRKPLVVYGESGSGKTSVLAKAASCVPQWFPFRKPYVVLRFLGTTVRSCSIRLVLGSVCWQICKLYDSHDVTEVPAEYPRLVTFFHELLKEATAERPLVILLDSLDQLTTSHRAHYLAWLPPSLPDHVHLVVSTLPTDHRILETLQSLIPDDNNFIQILPLGTNLSVELIKNWLKDAKRTLTVTQFEKVRHALTKCSLPLYTRLVFDEVCRWKSYTPPDQTFLLSTVTGVINSLFDRLERYHGEIFVSHVLSYLTASKNGMSDTELEDLLSIDDEVLNDVFQHWVPPVRRIPPLLWPRLLNELGLYIMKREANGIIVFYWYHRQFIAVAKQRYLSDKFRYNYIHSMIAHYFLGTWGGGHKKPFEYSRVQMKVLSREKKESMADRKVPVQPLVFHCDLRNDGKVKYNLRKLSELPYHLLMSKRIIDLKAEVLFNYDFLHAKLSAMGLQEIISDFRHVSRCSTNDAETQLLGNALRVGGNSLNKNPDTLAFDLLGRLLPYYNDYIHIRNLLQLCDQRSPKHSSAVPLFQCFDAPRAMLLYILEDHTQIVYDIVFSKLTNEVISVSKDNTIGFWDLKTSERTRTIDISSLHPGANTRLFLSQDGKYLICDSDALNSPIFVIEVKTGLLLHSVGKRTPLSRRGFVAGSLFCRQKCIVDLETGREVKNVEDFVSTRRYVTCGITPNEKYILIGEDEVTSMFDLWSGQLLAQYEGATLPSLFVITTDSRRAYVGFTEDCTFKVFDIDPESPKFGKIMLTFYYRKEFPHFKFLEGPRYGKELSEISICPNRQELVLLNIKRCHLVILNVNTVKATNIDVKAINANNKTYLFGINFTHDGKFVLAGASDKLHIWNAESGKLHTSLLLHTNFKFPLAVCNFENLVATGSTIHTAIKIWNLDKIQTAEPTVTHKYGNPIDMVVCAPDHRLVFVKEYYGFSTMRAYKYHDKFGIDIWNINTGNYRTYLPYEAYGELQQMEVSPDGHKLALLLTSRDNTNLCLVNIKTNKMIWSMAHNECRHFTISPQWDYATTESLEHNGYQAEVSLWNLMNGEAIQHLPNAISPVFTLDNLYLMYISRKEAIIIVRLTGLQPLINIPTEADLLQTIPMKHHVVMATKYETSGDQDDTFIEPTQVSLWYFSASKLLTRLKEVSPHGIVDISKDGTLGVDGYLQIFDLKNGRAVQEFTGGLSFDGTQMELKFVKFTYDGEFVLWVEGLFVKVGRVLDGHIMAQVSTHEKPTSLTVMDYGYVVVIGREDGHLLTMKLIFEEHMEGVRLRPPNLELRTQHLLDIPVCDPERISAMDPLYQKHSVKIKDSDLFKSSDEVQTKLLYAARMNAIIKTPSLTNLSTIGAWENMDEDLRRGSMPAVHYFEVGTGGRRSGSNTPSSTSPLSSPLVSHKHHKVVLKKRSISTSDLHKIGAPSDMRSNSMHDLFGLAQQSHHTPKLMHKGSRKSNPEESISTSPRTPPGTLSKEVKKGRRKSPSLQALFNSASKAFHHHTPAKALQQSSNMLIALAGVGGPVPSVAAGCSHTLPPKPPAASSGTSAARCKTKMQYGEGTNGNKKPVGMARGRTPSM